MDIIVGEQPVQAAGRSGSAAPAPHEVRRPYLVEVAERLWPAAAAGGPGGAGRGGGLSFLAAPGGRQPRFLLPSGRSGARALRAFSGHASLPNRLRTQLASGAMTVGLGGLLFRERVHVVDSPQGISAELARLLGTPVRLAVYGGHPRANRKPVLAAMEPGGRILAFAKVGMTPLTSDLVRAEAEALRQVAGSAPAGVRVPRLISRGTWHDMELVVQEALPVRRPRPMDRDLLRRTVDGVARMTGLESAPWGASAHAAQVRARLERTPGSPVLDLLGRMVDSLAEDAVSLPLGCWHGDFTPWNLVVAGGEVLIWDWERFASGVPLGFDLLHYDLQQRLARSQGPSAELPRSLVAAAPDRLAPLGLAPPQARRAVAAYLIEIASRYLGDDQAGVGARAGDVAAWLVPVVAEAVPAVAAERGA